MTNPSKKTFKFTQKEIEKLPAPDPSGKQTLYWDLDLTGFGILVSGVSKVRTYIVQRRLAGTGKTRRVTLAPTNVLTLDQAREKAKETLAVFYDKKDPKPARKAAAMTTLDEVYKAYAAARKTLRETSKDDYRWVLDRHLADWLHIPMREITRDMVEAKHIQIKERTDLGKKVNGKRRIAVTGAATANKAMRCFRALWNYALAKDETMPANPVLILTAADAWYPKVTRATHVQDTDLPDFYRAVDALGTEAGIKIEGRLKYETLTNRTASDYLKFILFTGLRRREAAQLLWTELDFLKCTIHIPGDKTKSGRDLNIPMSDYVFDLLVARQALGRDKSGYVFPANGKNKYIQEPKFFLGLIRTATIMEARPKGIHVTPHDLRRAFLTVAESTDLSPMALKALVNHSLGGDVTEGYVQMKIERLREPAQRIADKLKELCGIVPPKTVRNMARSKAA